MDFQSFKAERQTERLRLIHHIETDREVGIKKDRDVYMFTARHSETYRHACRRINRQVYKRTYRMREKREKKKDRETVSEVFNVVGA